MLQEKNALVTGASRGIGRAIALELARQGANVAIVYAGNEQKAKEVQEEIQAMGRKAEIYRCNVADFEAAKGLVDQVLEDFGGLDILVNNAGIVKDGMVLSMKEEDFDQVVDINLKGAFNLIKHTYSHFMRKRAGRIVNITSVVGLNGNCLLYTSPERVSMPDFDIDFCYERRQEVIDYVVRKYGHDHVAQIITFGTMAARGAIRDVGRALAVPYATADTVAKLVPMELGMTLDRALEVSAERCV